LSAELLFVCGFCLGVGATSLFVWAFLTDLLDRLQFGNNPSNYFYMLYLRKERLKKTGISGWLRKVIKKKDLAPKDRQRTEEEMLADIEKDVQAAKAADEDEEKHRKAKEEQVRQFLAGGKEAPL
jgi:hypothetical protein